MCISSLVRVLWTVRGFPVEKLHLSLLYLESKGVGWKQSLLSGPVQDTVLAVLFVLHTKYYHLHCTLHGCVCSARKTSELWTKWTKWSVCNWILFQLSCWMYLAPLKLINRGTSVTLIIASIIRMLLLSKVLLCCLSCRWYHLFPENVSFISSAPSGISATWFQLSSNNGWVWEGLRPCAHHAQYLSPLAFSWIGAFSTSSFEPCATLFSQINYFLVWCQ